MNISRFARKIYLRALKWICLKEIKRVVDMYPDIPIEELIHYHDCVAIECIEHPGKEKLIGVSLCTSRMLEKHKESCNEM